MSRHDKYPLIGSTTGIKKPEAAAECACCQKPATHYIRWQFDYMRGNDEVYGACSRHLQMARDNQNRYFAHMRTKEKWVIQRLSQKGAA